MAKWKRKLGYSKYHFRDKETDNSLLKMLYLTAMDIKKTDL
jgi:hypothetical protein